MNVADFVDKNFDYQYYAFISAVTTGTLKVRDAEKIMQVTGMTEKEFFDAYRKSFKGRKQVYISGKVEKPKYSSNPKKVNNPFR